MKHLLKTLYIIIFFLGFTLLPYKSFGQKNEKTVGNLHQLDSVIIQNNFIQIPFAEQNRNIEVIDQQDIQALPVQSIDELLGYVAGIDVRRRGEMGAQADISINGGTFDQTLVLINGIKIVDPQTGHNIMMLPISLESIKRIEILKGPAAAAYGVNAINGAINIVTRQPNKSGVLAHFYGGSSFKRDSISNHLYSGMDLGAGASIKTENSRHFLALNTIQSNGHSHNTAVDNNKIFYSNHLQLGMNGIEMMAGYASHDFGTNGFYSPPVDKESKERTQTTIAALKGRFRITDSWVIRPSVSYRYSDDNYILVKDDPSVYENKHYSNVIDWALNNSFKTKVGTFGVGLEYRNNHITSNSLGNHSRNDLGLFGNYSFDYLEDFLLNIGVYANYNAEYKWDIMPTLDAGYSLSHHLRIYANVGTGMRQPTYTDLYYSGPINIGNPELSPEKSWQTEIGLKYKSKKIRTSVQYFYRSTDDFIDWVKQEIDAPWTTLNYQKVKMNGFSASLNYALIPKSQNPNFNILFHGAYTYLNPKLGKTKGDNKFSNYALENLKHQLMGRLEFSVLNRFKLSITERYQKRISYKDYALLAARLSANFKDFEVFVDGNNLTNVEFIEAGATPLAGSWFTLGLKWQWWK